MIPLCETNNNGSLIALTTLYLTVESQMVYIPYFVFDLIYYLDYQGDGNDLA